MPANKPHPDCETEREFQAKIVRVARDFGWLVNHTYRAKLEDGSWRTTTTAVGLPDLLLVHPVWARFMALEVKGPRGRATPEQKRWVAAFQAVAKAAPGVVHSFVVSPADWPSVMRLLTRRTP